MSNKEPADELAFYLSRTKLSRLYRQVCKEMDLPWPPAIILAKEVTAEFDLEESG